MKYWFLLLIVCLFVFVEGRTCFAQQAATRKPITKPDGRDAHAICPTVSVSCPADPLLNELEFTATVTGGDPNVTPTYHWQVANGEIIAGQETPAIRVKREPCQNVTATLRISGFDTICSRTASCSTTICHTLPPPKKVDSYGLIPFDQVRRKLDLFAVALKKQPGAMGYIRFSRPKNNLDEVQKAAEEAKQYLVERFDIEKDGIRIDDGGTREEFMIELWLIPLGSYLPKVSPNINSPKN
ncbi:MAG TPA: hypothetical protein VJV03_13195 [Pyrinomonadaceae bacterium]|nr:hypothetical protein [Pyrinomonadaceae bacterium]